MLPDDARFCHKCGKPQREEPVFEEVQEEEAAPAPPPLPVTTAPPIGWNNGAAVRTGMLTGVLALVFASLSGRIAPEASIFVLTGAGFFAVYRYRTRTQSEVGIGGGARLGWISGLFGFLLATLIMGLFALALTNPDLANEVREQMKAQPGRAQEIDQVINILHEPTKMLSSVVAMFAEFTLLPTLGGVLCAKLLERKQSGRA